MDDTMKNEMATVTTKKLTLARDTVRVLRVKTSVRTGNAGSQVCRLGGSGISGGGGGISDTGIGTIGTIIAPPIRVGFSG